MITLELSKYFVYKLLIHSNIYCSYSDLNEIRVEISNERLLHMNSPRTKGSKYALEISNLYAGGLITIGLVFLQQLFSSGANNPGAYIAEVAFAVALPTLTGVLIANTIQSWYPYKLDNSLGEKLLQVIFLIGIIASVVGISGVFWSLSQLVIIVFFISLMLTSFVVILYISTLSNKP